MIVRKYYNKRKDGVKLYRTYSDADMLILQNETGIKYKEAIDIENSKYTYLETDEPINKGDNDEIR